MISLLSTLCFSINSCSKEDGTLIYLGKWVYESSHPEIDQSFNNSYIEIFEDKSFVFYDSSLNRYIQGKENKITLKGIVFIDPESGESVTFLIKGLKNNLLTFTTNFFGEETKIVLKKSSLPS